MLNSIFNKFLISIWIFFIHIYSDSNFRQLECCNLVDCVKIGKMIIIINEFWHISRDANFYISNVGEMPTQLCWVSQPVGVLGEWGRGSKPLLAYAIWVLALHWKILFGEQIHCCLAINLLHILQILAFIRPSSFKLDWKPFYPQ